MNLRCIYCQTPFTLARAEMLTAIVHMNEKNMNHYDAHCPRCRRANSISRQRMELFLPNWQEAAKQRPAMPVAASLGPGAPASTSLKTEPLPKALKATMVKKPAPRKTMKASAAKKPAPTASSRSTRRVKGKKTAAKSKPAARKAPAKKGKKK